jgi:hypothetical protein
MDVLGKDMEVAREAHERQQSQAHLLEITSLHQTIQQANQQLHNHSASWKQSEAVMAQMYQHARVLILKRSVHLFEYRRRVVVAAVSSWMLQLSQQKHQRHHEASLTLVKSQHTLARAQNLRFCLQSTSRCRSLRKIV